MDSGQLVPAGCTGRFLEQLSNVELHARPPVSQRPRSFGQIAICRQPRPSLGTGRKQTISIASAGRSVKTEWG